MINEYLELCRDKENHTRQHQVYTSSLYSKLCSESNILFCSDFQIAVFDIETVRYDKIDGCPLPDNLYAEIRMI
jgi:hypothetical protein